MYSLDLESRAKKMYGIIEEIVNRRLTSKNEYDESSYPILFLANTGSGKSYIGNYLENHFSINHIKIGEYDGNILSAVEDPFSYLNFIIDIITLSGPSCNENIIYYVDSIKFLMFSPDLLYTKEKIQGIRPGGFSASLSRNLDIINARCRNASKKTVILCMNIMTSEHMITDILTILLSSFKDVVVMSEFGEFLYSKGERLKPSLIVEYFR